MTAKLLYALGKGIMAYNGWQTFPLPKGNF